MTPPLLCTGALRRRCRACPDGGRAVNGFANARVGAAPTQVAGHRRVDVRVGRTRLRGQQCRGRHDLTRLAVPALGHVELLPCLLQRMRTVG